jgi:hypothetical protein
MTSAPILQDNRYHAARATADRDWRIPITPAKGVVETLPSPLEFDPRDPPRLVHVPVIASAIGGLFLLAGVIAALFKLVFWSAGYVG